MALKWLAQGTLFRQHPAYSGQVCRFPFLIFVVLVILQEQQKTHAEELEKGEFGRPSE
jgi:hypothetical protein